MFLLDLLHIKKSEPVEDESQFVMEDNEREKIFKYGTITYSKLKKEGLYTHEYWDYFIPMAYIFNFPKVLMLGLGGGTVAYQLTTLLKDSIDFDAVEVSRRAVELSKQFIPPTSANIMVGEGSAYLMATNRRYNVILLDAYVSSRIPAQFLTRQFVTSAYMALEQDGILAINFAVGLMGIIRFYDYVSKLKERFRVYKVNTALSEGNVIIVCSKKLDRGEIIARITANMHRNDDNEFLFRNYETMKEL